MADIKEILVAWDAGEEVSAISRRLGYSRPTVRKYARAADHVGLTRGGGRRSEAEWDRLAQAALARVAALARPTPQADAVARFRTELEPLVGEVPLSVLPQRFRDERGLQGQLGHLLPLRPGQLARATPPAGALVNAWRATTLVPDAEGHERQLCPTCRDSLRRDLPADELGPAHRRRPGARAHTAPVPHGGRAGVAALPW